MTPSQPPFRVSLAARAPTRLATLKDRAQEHGLGLRLAAFLRGMMANLEQRPRDWGDPVTPLFWMRCVAYQRYVLSEHFLIEYTVHDTESIVWLTDVIPLPDNPLADE